MLVMEAHQIIAAERLERLGPNRIEPPKPTHYGVLLIRQFLGGGFDLQLLSFDLVGPVTGFVAASVAWQRLR